MKGRPRKQNKEHITLNIRSDILKWAKKNINNISRFLEDQIVVAKQQAEAHEMPMQQISRNRDKEALNRNEPY